jgi:hypothetical protein
MFNQEVTEMNYKRKISRETSPACKLNNSITEDFQVGGNIQLFEDKNDKKNYFETIPKMG